MNIVNKLNWLEHIRLFSAKLLKVLEFSLTHLNPKHNQTWIKLWHFIIFHIHSYFGAAVSVHLYSLEMHLIKMRIKACNSLFWTCCYLKAFTCANVRWSSAKWTFVCEFGVKGGVIIRALVFWLYLSKFVAHMHIYLIFQLYSCLGTTVSLHLLPSPTARQMHLIEMRFESGNWLFWNCPP